jgi:type VI secretion system protein ImpG
MTDTLYRYYEQELHYFRQQSQEFAKRYPAAAGRLQLEPTRSVDPHVERLIESFAFLAGRIHKRLDDDFPEITDALLGVLYPHYLAPIPSTAIVQFEPEPANVQPTGIEIKRHTRLHTQKLGDVACQYRTCYPVTLWPLKLSEAQLVTPPFPEGVRAPSEAAAAIRLRITCQADARFPQLSLEKLRFYLCADQQLGGRLYELLFNHVTAVEFRSADGGEPVSRLLEPQDCLAQAGFDRDEGLLPYNNQSFLGYRLLSEMFSFPDKFLFFDLGGWREVRESGMQKSVDVLLYLDRAPAGLEREVNSSLFRLGCTPIVNLFPHTAEPITLSYKKTQYPVTPDYRRQHAYEVYSIEEVYTADSQSPRVYKPFYDFRHADSGNGDSGREQPEAYYLPSRRHSNRPDDHGADVDLQLVDLNLDPHTHGEETLVVRCLCTNRELPIQLQHAGDRLRFELETAAPLRAIRCLRSPTTPLRPPLRRHAQWRLVSHLALNHLSISDPAESKQALQEMLRLYDFSESETAQQLAAVNSQLIDGIDRVSSRRVSGRVGGALEGGVCRGIEMTIDFDEEKYAGTCGFLFAAVLERFFALYASINSFTQMVATIDNGKSLIRRWPPRAGETQLL